MPLSEEPELWRHRQPSCHSQQSQSSSSYCAREEQLAEKEVQLSELESLVRQAEMKAEQTRKEKELSDWEQSLQMRELECKRRLEAAHRILHESRMSDTASQPRSIQSPEPTSQFPDPPSLHSTPVSRGPGPRLAVFGQQPIVLPSTTKLPPSAIRLSSSSSSVSMINRGPGPSSLFPVSDEAPMNLCKPRTSMTSETSEDSIAAHNMSSASSFSEMPPLSEPIQAPIEVPNDAAAPNINIVQLPATFASSHSQQQPELDLPCVDTNKDKVYDFCVKVVDDTRSSIEAGDAVKVSYPTTDNDQIVLGDNIVLEEFLQSSGSGASEVTFVAEEGPNGQITLIPQDNSFNQEQHEQHKLTPEDEGAVQQLETELEIVRKDIEDINSPGEPKENNSVVSDAGCDVDYFENRVKDFEEKITGKSDDSSTEASSSSEMVKIDTNPVQSTNKRPAEEVTSSESKRRKTIDKPSEPTSKSVPGKQPTVAKETVFGCGRCSSVLQSERSWKRHRDTVHGGSARLKEDPQGHNFTAEQEDQAWRQALKAFKKIHCPRCNKTMFVDSKSLEAHLEDCNVDCNVNAAQVDRENNITSQNVKRPAKTKSNVAKKDPVEMSVTEGVGGERNKRRAAAKARSTVAAFVEAMKSRIDGDSSDGDHDLADEDSDENFNVNSEISISNFYKHSKIGKKTSYKCNLCCISMKRKVDIESHITSSHKDKLSEGKKFIQRRFVTTN